MKKIGLLFSVLFIIFSCSVNRQEYVVASELLTNFKKPFSGVKIDSIDVVDYSFAGDNSSLDSYIRVRTRKLSGAVCADCENIRWTDSKNSWILSDEDIDFMKSEIKKHKKIIWDASKFRTNLKLIKTVDYPIFYDDYNKNKETERRIKKEQYLIYLSTPIFNKKKDKAIISYNMVLLPHIGATLIYIKDKKKWKLAGYYE